MFDHKGVMFNDEDGFDHLVEKNKQSTKQGNTKQQKYV